MTANNNATVAAPDGAFVDELEQEQDGDGVEDKKGATDEEVVVDVDVKQLYDYPGRPLATREVTSAMVCALVGTADNKGGSNNNKKKQKIMKESATATANATATVQDRPELSNVYGNGPFLVSDVPLSCRSSDATTDIVLGIDEAGRGSVLGPMVYGAAYWNAADLEKIPQDFNDSKQLNEDQRERLFEAVLTTPEIGFVARVIHASEISRNMLRNYNLNQQSHAAAIDMLKHVTRTGGVRVTKAYVDTVGNAASYQRMLEEQFPSIQFVVESKADAKYPPCSAASVGALHVSVVVVLRLLCLFV